MQTNQRPPILPKKGIAILQPSKTLKSIENDEYSSGIRSVRSSSRSRGISIGRSSGIKMDKIYEQKHFPPAPSTSQPAKQANMERTLASCRSLKLVSLQSETSISNNGKESNLKEPIEQEGSGIKLKIASKVQQKEKSKSPIGKLNFGKESTQSSKLSTQQRQLKLIKF